MRLKPASVLDRMVGRTVKKAEINKIEASDSCFYANLEIHFEDGSMFSVLLHASPRVEAQFFKDDTDEGAEKEVVLIKP